MGSVESGEVWVVSTAAQKIVQTIPVTQSGPVSSIAFTPDGTQAWVFGIGGMSVVDVAAGKVLSFVPVTGIFPDSQAPNAGPVALPATASTRWRSTPRPPTLRGSVPSRSSAPARSSCCTASRSAPEPLGLAIDYDGQTAYVTNGDGTVSYFTVPG